MAEVTMMVLKVDLQCSKCYNRVKKVLCQFPEIRDQVYDEKKNTVTIKVVSCCPERLMQKICCKGGKSIKSIEKPGDPKGPKSKPVVVIIDPPKSKPQQAKAPEPAPTPKAPVLAPTSKALVSAPSPKAPEPAPSYPLGYPNYPSGVCCREFYRGHGGGPCQQLGYGKPICYDGYYGRPVYDSWGGGNYRSRGDYFCEENPSSCSIM